MTSLIWDLNVDVISHSFHIFMPYLPLMTIHLPSSLSTRAQPILTSWLRTPPHTPKHIVGPVLHPTSYRVTCPQELIWGLVLICTMWGIPAKVLCHLPYARATLALILPPDPHPLTSPALDKVGRQQSSEPEGSLIISVQENKLPSPIQILTLISRCTSIFPAFFRGKYCLAEEATLANKCRV